MKRDIINLEKPAPETPTLRDMFAMAALQGALGAGDKSSTSGVAAWSYNMADAMLEARKHD